MEIINTGLTILNICIVTNLLYAFLFLISRSAGEGFANWISSGSDIVTGIMYIFFIGLTFITANLIYETYNWFISRMLLIVYIVALIFIMTLLP
ncbi:hypothetical protein CGZ90_16755 [Fictibacillus aquaticus]|uniref:Uncharacterized protein n=1 Tax=Fictibacillus aquaticus TaxID=2021314 RepID=A0A235F5Z1_9BACL|nr:hypothetical protein CGZ90_16755 [Fictibacillus aquaticus]